MSNNINSIKAAITDNLGSLRSGTSPAQIERVATAILNRGNKSVRQTINDEVGYIPSTYSNVIDDIVAAIEALITEEPATEATPADLSADDIKAAIVSVIGKSNADSVSHVVNRVAVAVANRGASTIREVIVNAVGGLYVATYPEYVNSIVTAVESLEGKAVETSPEAGIKSIKHTIGEALPAIHIPADYYTKVVDALTEREYQIASKLANIALDNLPIDYDAAQSFIEQSGLTFRPEPVVEVVPEPEVAPEAEDETAPEAAEDATFREDRRDAATEAVTLDSNDGVVGEVATGKSDADRLRKLEKQVKKLTKLAKRHLSF